MADPISIAGLGLSVTSLFFQLFSGALKGIHLILDMRDIPNEYQTLVMQLDMEQQRLMCWGDVVGLFGEPNADGELRLSVPLLLRNSVREYIENLWMHVHSFLDDEPTFAEPLRSVADINQGADAAGSLSSRSKLDSLFRKCKSFGFPDRLKWSVRKAEKLEAVLQRLSFATNAVISISQDSTQNAIFRGVELTYSEMLLLKRDVKELEALIRALDSKLHEDMSTSNVSAPTRELQHQNQRFMELARLKLSTRQQEEAPTAYSTGPLERALLQLGDFIGDGPRREASYGGQSGYWVEPRAYEDTANTKLNKDAIETFIIKQLVSVLSEESTAIRIPRCKGYVDYPEVQQFLLLFEYPTGVATNAQLVSLAQVLQLDASPDLADRIELARRLSEAIYYLHSVGWLHKALRPHNIIFFRQPGGAVEYGKPYISGFEDARPSRRSDLTQRPGDDTPVHDFYRHPRVQSHVKAEGNNNEFRMAFDMYSLGVILVELALWRPITTTFLGEVEGTKNYLLENLGQVGVAAGRTFETVSRMCLSGWDALEHPDVNELDTNGLRKQLFTFGDKVIRKLQDIQVDTSLPAYNS